MSSAKVRRRYLRMLLNSPIGMLIYSAVTPDENTDGLRRGKRTRYKPLEWWRCEKVVYGRREGGISLVPTIKEIVRLPKEEPQPLGAKHRRKRPPRSKSKTLEVEAELVLNPEEGWDDETEIEGTVINIDSGEELRKRPSIHSFNYPNDSNRCCVIMHI